MNEIKLISSNNTITADSRQIARHFEKRHDHIMRDIGSILNQCQDAPNFGEMFIPSTYKDSYGRRQRSYQLTRDGFSLLVMGFTGQKALSWKLKYIEAFNAMENQMSRVRIPETFADALRLAADQAEQLEKQRPLVRFAEHVASSEQSMLVREIAKIASKQGIEIGNGDFGTSSVNGGLFSRTKTSHIRGTLTADILK